MSRAITILLASIVFFNCQSVTTSVDIEEVNESISQEKVTVQCTQNNESEDCELELTTIDYQLPPDACITYDQMIQIDTRFSAPAGLKKGSTSRVDWEFYPKGNSGFWISPIDNPTEAVSGTIEAVGCFSFGDQTSLRIARTIIDHDGKKSNSMVVEIPRPKNKVVATGSPRFDIVDDFATIN